MVPRSNTRSSIKVAKLQVFNRGLEKISGFIIVCRLSIRIIIREDVVEKQI